MAQSSQMMQTKMLDYFFTLKNVHAIAYQPIVELATGELVEYECLFRPEMPGLQTSISSVVQAAIDTGRTIELDAFIVRIDPRRGSAPSRPQRRAARPAAAPPRDQLHAGQPARPPVRGRGLRRRWSRRPASIPARSRSNAPSSRPSPTSGRSSSRSRRCAGSASGSRSTTPAPATRASALIAALRPSIIKIDREIASGHRPRRREAGARRGVRVVRRPDRRAAPRRGHRAPRRPRDADGASASTSARAT